MKTWGLPPTTKTTIMEGSGQTYFSIPRYSILDRDNSIISNNAPRPSDSLTFRKIIDGIDGPEN